MNGIPLLALAALLTASVPWADAAPADVPFPTARTSLLKKTDVVYVIDGAARIPPGVEITLQKGVRLRGRNGATLEVAGSFVVHGVSGLEVEIAGVRIVLPKKVQQLHLDMCQLIAGTCVVSEKDKPTNGILTIENCKLEGSTGIQIEATGGKIKLMSLNGDAPVRLVGIDADGKANRVKGSLRTSLFNGLEVVGLYEVTVRSCEIRVAASFRNVSRLDFDANHIVGAEVLFEQADAAAFTKTKISKCDIQSATLKFHAPIGKRKSVRVVVEKCWFDGEMNLKKIAALIHDQADDPQNAVKVLVKKPMKRKLGLAADWSSR